MLVLGQPERVGQGRQHRGRRLRVASLLEAHEVVDADARQRGDLLTPQARRAAPARVAQAHVRRLQRLPPGPQESTEVDVLTHAASVCRDDPRISLVPVVPGSMRPSCLGAAGASSAACQQPTSPRPPPDPRPLVPRSGPLVRRLRHPPPRRRQGARPLHRLHDRRRRRRDPGDTSVTAVVQLASVDTGNADRDAHIQADDMVDVATRPTLTFRSSADRAATARTGSSTATSRSVPSPSRSA